MFMVGRIYYRLHQWSGLESDLDLSLDHLTRFVNHYPQSPLADDALFLSAEITFQQKKNPGKGPPVTSVADDNLSSGRYEKKGRGTFGPGGQGHLLESGPPDPYR